MWMLSLSAVSFVYAEAGETTASRVPTPAALVDRPLVLGKGWFEASLGVDFKRATGSWTNEGEAVEWDNTSWTYTTQLAGVRYGVTRDVEVYATLPFHYVQLWTAALQNPAAFGLGEPTVGARYQLFTRQIPTSSVLLDLELKLPTSSEVAGTYVGGVNMRDGFALSTGQADLALFARGKQQFGPFAVVADLGFVERLSGLGNFVVFVGETAIEGRFKPGSEVRANVSPMLQLGALVLRGDLGYRQWFPATVTGTGAEPASEVVPDSDGWSVDGGGAAIVAVSRHVDLEFSINAPIRGESLPFFPLEHLSPTRGVTYGTALHVRL